MEAQVLPRAWTLQGSKYPGWSNFAAAACPAHSASPSETWTVTTRCFLSERLTWSELMNHMKQEKQFAGCGEAAGYVNPLLLLWVQVFETSAVPPRQVEHHLDGSRHFHARLQ